MKCPQTATVLLVLAFAFMASPQTALGQRTKVQSLEGVVSDSWIASKGKVIIVDSGGSKYWFSLANLYFGKDVVSEDATEIGARVKVTYKSLTRSRDGSYEGTPLRVVSLTNSSASQKTNSQSTTALEEWDKFWPAFRTAVKKIDRMAIKRMIANPFDSGGGGDYSPDKWIRFLDEEKAWGEIQRSVASGTKPFEEYSRDIGKPSRVTNRRHLIFVFSNGRWRWAAVMGD